MSRRLDLLLLCALFGLSLLLRLAALSDPAFDGLYGQDAYTYFEVATALPGVLFHGQPAPTYYWPLGYPLVLSVVFALFGSSAATAQSLTLLLGSLLAPLMYALGRVTDLGRLAALGAALVLVVSGQVVQSSLVVMSDIPATAWTLCSAVALWWAVRRRAWPLLAVSAGFLALACITRWLYLVLALPWLLVVLTSWRLWPRRAWLLAPLPALLVIGFQLVYSAAYPPPRLYNWDTWSLANAFQREFVVAEGPFSYAQVNALFYAGAAYEPYFVSPLLTLLVVLGVVALWRRPPLAAFALLWFLLPYVALVGVPHQNVRYNLILLPSVALLVGLGAQFVVCAVSRPPVLRVTQVALVLLFAAAGVHTFSASRPVIDTFLRNQQADREIALWAAQMIPAQSNVYTFGLTHTLRHRTTLLPIELYYETPATLAGRWAEGQADYLLVNLWIIEHQWAGGPPHIAYHWLFDHRGLTRLGQSGHYTLFQVGA